MQTEYDQRTTIVEVALQTKEVHADIRVLLVDDHLAMRETLRMLLGANPAIVVIGEAEDGVQALQLLSTLHPDVVVTDIEMPRLNGLEATRQIRKLSPQTGVVTITVHENKSYFQEGLEAGATSCIPKRLAGSQLPPAVYAAAHR